MLGEALASSVISWIQSQGKQQTLEVIKSGQQMDVSIPYTKESSIPVTHCFLFGALVMNSRSGTAGPNTSLARTHSSSPVSRDGIFIIKSILLLASHICVTEDDTKYGCIFLLAYLKVTV